MKVSHHGISRLRFGQFDVDLLEGKLLNRGVPVRIENQPFQILVALLERPGEVVEREELRNRLWPSGTYVDFDEGVNTAISKLRYALHDSAETPVFVETVPRRGYRFLAPISDVTAIEATSRNVNHDAASEPEPTATTKTSWWKLKAAIALGVCVVVAGLLYPFVAPRIERLLRLYELQRLTVVPLTALPGTVLSPTFSPDGSQVAFAWDGGEPGHGFDLYVKVIGAGEPLRLTQHPSALLSAAWSPDGRSIALSRVSGEDSGIYQVSPNGGPERKLTVRRPITLFGNEISWSHDGRSLAYIDALANTGTEPTLQLFLLSMDTLEKTMVQTNCSEVTMPTFSPRGSFLTWVCNDGMHVSTLWLLRLRDGNRTRLLSWVDFIFGMAWSPDESRMVFSSESNFGALWDVSMARPDSIERLPVGHDASNLAVNPAGLGLAYVQGSANVNIWRLDLLASPPQARKLVTSSREQIAPSISPDGSKIAFESTTSGKREIWVCDADGSNAEQLTHFGLSTTGTPRWSPDGKLIAFDARVGGEANIYLVDPHGGIPHKLSIDQHQNQMPSWSRDGTWIYFGNGDDAYNPTVWKVPSIGGHAVQVAKRGATFALESPDGEFVYFAREKKLWRVKIDGSTEQQVAGMPELDATEDEWFPSAAGIYFLAHAGSKATISLFDLKTKRVRPIFALEKPPPYWIGGMPVSKDGKYLLYPQVDEQSSNLMLVENWR